MKIDNKFNIEQTVYLRTDAEQNPRVVVSIVINPGDLSYRLACGVDTTEHFEFEISDKPDVMMTSQN